MQVCTTVCGNTALMASGKPFSPSTTAMRMSWAPRVFSSLTTRSQNLAPSVLLDPDAENLLGAVRQDAERDINRLVAHEAFVADLDPDGIEEHQRVAQVERPVLPFGDFVEHRIGDRRDQVRRNVDAVKLLKVTADLAHRHPPRIHRDHLPVEAREPALIFWRSASGRRCPPDQDIFLLMTPLPSCYIWS